mgnify:CR=1 FL=1
MKINFHSTTPPRVATALILALSLAFTFPSCSDGSSGGSDDDCGQVSTPVENPSDSNGNGSGSNANPSNPSNPDSGSTNPEPPPKSNLHRNI